MSRPNQVAAQEDDEQPREMRCTRHPGKATNLRCGRCERPFCYSCLVRTPVGLRCFDCATPRRFPGRSATPQQYLAAVALGLAVSLFLGALWALVPAIGLWVSLAIGFGTGEAVSWAAGRRRGPGLQVIAGACALLGALAGLFLPLIAGGMSLTFLADSIAAGQFAVLNLDLVSLLLAAMAVVLPIIRLR